MKKVKPYLSLVLVLLFAFALAGCAPKTPATVEAFTETAEKAGFDVTDYTEKTDTQGIASAIIVAVKEGINIEFWELNDSKTGKEVFNNAKETFTSEHHAQTMSKSVTMNNYDYYSFIADGEFHLISRIDNTVIYCDADKSYKDEIIDFAEELGYR